MRWRKLRRLSSDRGGHAVHLCNAFTLALASRNPEFAQMLNRASLNLPDGTPVTWAGRALGACNARGPVRGPDLMLQVMKEGVEWGATHYLYGGTPLTSSLLHKQLAHEIPGILICGVESPPFRALTSGEEASLLQRFEAAAPTFVWVGLGTPKQDRFVDHWSTRVDSVWVPVGAAFDFAAGTIKPAPHWMHGSGLEWTYRLAREPRRLWRRYLVGNTVFAAAVIADLMRGWRK